MQSCFVLIKLNELWPCTLRFSLWAQMLCQPKCFYWLLVRMHFNSFCVSCRVKANEQRKWKTKTYNKETGELYNQSILLTMLQVYCLDTRGANKNWRHPQIFVFTFLCLTRRIFILVLSITRFSVVYFRYVLWICISIFFLLSFFWSFHILILNIIGIGFQCCFRCPITTFF